jgi:C4-dicarboxylate transporter DctM subunit
MAATSVLSYILSYERIPLLITQFITGLDVHPIAFLLAINVLLLVLGCFLEIISVILIVVPIILPSVIHLGIDPIHLGIVIIVNMELAVITPPVGMNLFVVSAISRQRVIEVFKGTLPFVALIAACLLLLILFPGLSRFTLDFFKS